MEEGNGKSDEYQNSLNDFNDVNQDVAESLQTNDMDLTADTKEPEKENLIIS